MKDFDPKNDGVSAIFQGLMWACGVIAALLIAAKAMP